MEKGRGRHNQGWTQRERERAIIAGAAILVQGCDDLGEAGLHAYWQHTL